MALGNNYDNNKKDQYMPVYYSSYNTGNSEGIDPSALSYQFYNRMLKISISPMKVNNGDKVSYDHENAAFIWLTHTKARLFRDVILRVLDGKISNGGVPSGVDGLLRFSDGKELGVSNPCIIINKVNENGEVTAAYAYEFKTKHHYAIENYDPKDSSHKKTYDKNIEIQQLLDLLESYYLAMTGAMPYAVMDGMRFTTNTNNTKLDLIMSKLGIDYKPGTTSRSSDYSGSYFDRNSSSSSNSSDGRSMRSATMDDLED